MGVDVKFETPSVDSVLFVEVIARLSNEKGVRKAGPVKFLDPVKVRHSALDQDLSASCTAAKDPLLEAIKPSV